VRKGLAVIRVTDFDKYAVRRAMYLDKYIQPVVKAMNTDKFTVQK
jgi:hypothetical protein